MVIQCDLCPKYCVMKPGESGDCRVRVNIDGRLRAVTYGFPSAVHVDPIEKKPLNHFLPGTSIFSIATVGCNLHCLNCQNWEISQQNPEEAVAFPLAPADVVAQAKRQSCVSVAYTYTDPSVYYEYTLDSCILAREAGLRNVLVTAGYLNEPPLRELCKFVDAATIDLKAMSDRFYREICGATLAPVLNYFVVSKAMGVHVEASNLLIPTLNDKDEEIEALCRWIKENLGRENPLPFLFLFFLHSHCRPPPPAPPPPPPKSPGDSGCRRPRLRVYRKPAGGGQLHNPMPVVSRDSDPSRGASGAGEQPGGRVLPQLQEEDLRSMEIPRRQFTRLI